MSTPSARLSPIGAPRPARRVALGARYLAVSLGLHAVALALSAHWYAGGGGGAGGTGPGAGGEGSDLFAISLGSPSELDAPAPAPELAAEVPEQVTAETPAAPEPAEATVAAPAPQAEPLEIFGPAELVTVEAPEVLAVGGAVPPEPAAALEVASSSPASAAAASASAPAPVGQPGSGLGRGSGPVAASAGAGTGSGAASGTDSTGRRGSAGRGDHAPMLLRADPPAYPETARRHGEEGTVLCRIAVRADGQVDHVEVVTSSGHALLDQAARDGLLGWRFLPAVRHGHAVPEDFTHRVVFRLSSAASAVRAAGASSAR